MLGGGGVHTPHVQCGREFVKNLGDEEACQAKKYVRAQPKPI